MPAVLVLPCGRTCSRPRNLLRATRPPRPARMQCLCQPQVGAQFACVPSSRRTYAARRTRMKRLAVAVCLLSLATSAEAYVGPGMGLGVISAVLGFLTAIVLALAGMVWYPVKRMIRARRRSVEPRAADFRNRAVARVMSVAALILSSVIFVEAFFQLRLDRQTRA